MHSSSPSPSSSASTMLIPSPALPSPNLSSRRSLPYIPHDKPPAADPPYPVTPLAKSGPQTAGFDVNVISVLAALVCAVMIGVVLNLIVRFTLQVVKQMWSESDPSATNQSNQFGVKRAALRGLPTLVYSARLGLQPGLQPECTICLSEFAPGERLRVLPKCGHGFHAGCVDRWLADHSSCPTCRQCSFGKSQLVAGCSEATAGAGTDAGPVQVVRLTPAVEDLMEHCRVCC